MIMWKKDWQVIWVQDVRDSDIWQSDILMEHNIEHVTISLRRSLWEIWKSFSPERF